MINFLLLSFLHVGSHLADVNEENRNLPTLVIPSPNIAFPVIPAPEPDQAAELPTANIPPSAWTLRKYQIRPLIKSLIAILIDSQLVSYRGHKDIEMETLTFTLIQLLKVSIPELMAHFNGREFDTQELVEFQDLVESYFLVSPFFVDLMKHGCWPALIKSPIRFVAYKLIDML